MENFVSPENISLFRSIYRTATISSNKDADFNTV